MHGDISVVSSNVEDTIVDGGFVEPDASSDFVSKEVELFKLDVGNDVKAAVYKSEVKVILVEVETTLKHFLFIFFKINYITN